MSTNQAIHTEASEHASNQCQERPFIDLLPVELLERVISLGVEDRAGDPEIKDVCMWRTVCRRWKEVIDDCPSLWSTIVLGDWRDRTKHIKPQLENSKAAPLHLEILSLGQLYSDDHLVQLLADSAYRWKSVVLSAYPERIIRRWGSPPSILDTLHIERTRIPQDCRLFSLARPTLRKLVLVFSSIPRNFDPTFGLEVLHINDVREYGEDGSSRYLSIRKLHHFLQANPNLRTLYLYGSFDSSQSDHDLQPIDLPKLEDVVIRVPEAFHLFRAEHCVAVRFIVGYSKERPSPSSWTTTGHKLRRAESMKISVTSRCLRVTAVTAPYKVEVTLDDKYGDSGHLLCSILEDLLNEAEKDTPISARVEVGLFADKSPGGDFDIGLEILELLQTPISDASSGQSRWRIPNLDTINILKSGLPYHHLRAFIQARSNGNCVQPASPVTGIFIRRDRNDYGGGEDVLNEVMACSGGENDGERAVC